APEVVAYTRSLMAEYLRRGDGDRADAVGRALVDRYPSGGADASRARTVYAMYLASRDQLADAERYYEEAVALSGDDGAAACEANAAYADFETTRWARAAGAGASDADARRYFDHAEKLLRDAIAADPKPVAPYRQLARLYQAAERYVDAVAVCRSRLDLDADEGGIAYLRHKSRLVALLIEASRASMLHAVRLDDADEREAWLLRAEGFAQSALDGWPGHPRALSQRGQVKVALGDDRGALDDLRRADEDFRARDYVDWHHTMVLCRLHLRLREPGAALAVLERSLERARTERPRDATFWSLYAKVLLENRDLDRAFQAAADVLRFDAENEPARRVQAEVYRQRGELAQAEAVVEGISGGAAMRAVLQAESLRRDGDVDGAVGVLLAALEKTPAHTTLVATAVQLLLWLDRRADAAQVVQRALSAAPDDARFKQWSVLTQPGLTPEQRDAELLALIDAEPDVFKRSLDKAQFFESRDKPAEALTHLDAAEAHLLARDTAMAATMSKAAHRALLEKKVRLAAQLDDQDALEAARTSAIEHNVDGADGKSIEGIIHIYRNELELAIAALTDAVNAQPTDGGSLSRLGRCLAAVGRDADALDCFERACAANPKDGPAHRGLAQLALQRGDQALYEQHLASAAALMPRDAWVREQLMAQQDKADPAAAIARREQAAQRNPDDFENLSRLAALYELVGDTAKADDMCARLLELRPDDQTLVATVATYFRRTNRPEASLDLLQRSIASMPTDEQRADAHVPLARHYIDVGDDAAAEAALLSGVDVAETLELCQNLAAFYVPRQARKALPWFDKAIDHARAVKSPRLNQMLAARVECLLRPGVDDVAAARRRVDEFLNETPGEPAALLLSSDVAAREGDMDGAVDRLTRYLAQRPGDATGLYRRAQLYLAQGRSTLAVDDLKTLRAEHPDALGLRPRIALAREYRRTGRKDAWLAELASLVEAAPDSLPILTEYVQAVVTERRLGEADALLTARIHRAGDTPDAALLRLRGMVRLELKDTARALADYRRSAELDDFSPSSVTAALAAYARVGLYADGVSYYETHVPASARTGVVVARYAHLLASAGQREDAVARFRDAMQRALNESRDAVRRVNAELRRAIPIDDAITLFDTLGAGGSDDPAARVNTRIVAYLLHAAGRETEGARRLASLLASADPAERAGLLVDRGIILHDVDPAAARAAYEEALKYDASDWQALNNLAYLIAETMHLPKQALPYAERAVALNPSHTTLDTLGWVYVALGRHRAAIAALARAASRRPDDAAYQYYLGDAYRRDGQFGRAKDVLSRARTAADAAGDADTAALIRTALDKTRRRTAVP
ncbi:MAG: tetratricopeptide repeat protein, partial [Phycisphaerae bacterium]